MICIQNLHASSPFPCPSLHPELPRRDPGHNFRDLQIERRVRQRERDLHNTKSVVLDCSRVNQRHFGGKRNGHRHSTTSFRENAVVAKTSYQMLGILYSYHLAIGRGLYVSQRK